MFSKGVLSRLAYLDTQEAHADIEAKIEKLILELEHISSLRRVAEADYMNSLSALASNVETRYSDAVVTHRSSVEAIKIIDRKLGASELRSPVAGVVDQLNITTLGQVVTPAAELLQIVPIYDALVFEAVVPNTEFGFINLNQKATLKFDAFPSEIYGAVRGEVTKISPNAIELPGGQLGFVVQISLSNPNIEFDQSSYNLSAGMTASVDIVTGERSVISYFLGPIVSVLQNSIGER